jgi:hypothetical protein
MKLETVIISKHWKDKCLEFAEKSLESSKNHWRKRNVVSEARMKEDIYTGKMGEVGAYIFLKSLDLSATKPDFEIYEKGRKSFDADITCGKYNLHCKSQSQSSADKYGTSWILQYSGKGFGHTDKLFKKRTPQDYLVPTQVLGDRVAIYGIIKISLLFDQDMIELPKAKWFQDTKRAIYWDTIKYLSHYDRWGFIKGCKNDSR